MFRLETDRALTQAFRPRDRRVIELPKGLTYPHFERDYLAWRDASGTRMFLVFAPHGSRQPVGLVFRRDSDGTGVRTASMCDWCHYYGSSNEVGLLSTAVSSKRRVGVLLCLDLRCKDKLEDAANRTGRHPREGLKLLQERMFRFAQEALGLNAPQPEAEGEA